MVCFTGKVTFGFVVVLSYCLTFCHMQSRVKETIPSVTPKTVLLNEGDDPYIRVRQAWMKLDKDLRKQMGKLLRSVFPGLMREIYARNVSSDCLSGLLHVTTALRKGRLWPYEMIDSMGKLPEGFLRGSLTMLGDYKECLGIAVNEKNVNLQGQYCTVTVIPPLPEWRPFLSLHQTVPELVNVSEPGSLISHLTGFVHNLYVTSIKIGICVPSVCSTNDIHNLVQILPERLGIDWKFDVSRCEVKEELSFTETQKGILYVLGLVAALVICGTLVDIVCTEENLQQNVVKGTAYHIIRSFSFLQNGRKLSNYNCSDDRLRFVYGIMFFSFFWILVANSFMYVNYDVASNLLEAFSITQTLVYEVLLNRVFPMQAFFYLTGFVAAYNLLKSPEADISIWKYFLKRYWRYTPTYILVIMLIMLMPTWGTGPSWAEHVDPIYTRCHNNWWSNILYINNYLDGDVSCLDHTWMLAVDAQLYLIGIFVLIPLKSRPKIGLMVNFVLMAASLLTVALTNVYYDLPPNEMSSFLIPKDRMFYSSHTYYRVYSHLCPYCAGIAVGYLMAQKPKFQMSRGTSCIIGIVTWTGALATLTSVHEWNSGIIPSPLVGAVYASFGKAAQAAFYSWLTVSCMAGPKGIMNDILSWRPFAFFARLIFIGYIIHPAITQTVMGFKKSHLFIEDIEIVYIVVYLLVATYAVSYVCYLGFEAPLLSLTEIIRKKVRSRPFNPDIDYSGNSCIVVMSEKPMRYKDTKNFDQAKTKF